MNEIERLAAVMIRHSIATGHGENFEALLASLDDYLTAPVAHPAPATVEMLDVTTAMVDAAWNAGKKRRMTGRPNDFRAVLEAALAPATEGRKS